MPVFVYLQAHEYFIKALYCILTLGVTKAFLSETQVCMCMYRMLHETQETASW